MQKGPKRKTKEKLLNILGKEARVNEKGSITLFVVVSMLFMLIVLILLSANVTNKSNIQAKQIKQIEEQYKVSVEKIKEAYDTIFAGNIGIAKFDTNGGSEVEVIAKEIGEELGPLPTSEKPGYTFDGWYTRGDGAGEEITENTVMPKNGIVARAKWNLNTYTITCDLNGGQLSQPNPTTYTVESEDITLNNPTRNGYHFLGWTGTGLTEATENVTIEHGSTGNRTYNAIWAENTYTIAFDSNGGMGTMADMTEIRCSESKVLTANTFIKYGCRLKGWATTQERANAGTVDYNDGETVTGLTTAHDETVTLYAVWELQEYTFNSNGGTFAGGGTTNVVKYGPGGHAAKYSHTSNITDTGYKTSGYGDRWSNANITGTDRGDTSEAHVVTIPGATSLSVTVYYNGEAVTYDWVTVWQGSHPDYTASSNYSSGVSGGTKLGGSQTGSYTVNGNQLNNMGKAEFTIEGDTVTFGFKSDSSQCGDGYGYYAIIEGDTLGVVSGEYKEPTIANKAFDGWNTKADGTGMSYTESSMVEAVINEDTELYALWIDATLLPGEEFNKKISSRASFDTSNTDIKSIIFDNYTESNRNAIASEINNPIPVDFKYRGTINAYKVLDTTDNKYNVYVLADYPIYANSNCSSMFNKIEGVANISFNNFNTSRTVNMSRMFESFGTNTMTSLDVSAFDTSKVTNMSYMFSDCGYTAMTSVNLGDKFDTSSVTNMSYMFSNCGYTAMTSLDLGDKFDTSSVTNMSYMFNYCGYKSMTSLDLGDKFDTSSVTNMSYMFSYCGHKTMTSLDLGDKFDTSSVTNMDSMFRSCGYTAMTSLDLGDKFDTSSVTNMSSMFSSCGHGSLTSLDLGDKFDTSSVTNMESMFSGCGYTAMTTFDLGDKFNTSNVTNMSSMFFTCGYTSLTYLDLGDKFDTSKVQDMSTMFRSCGRKRLVNFDLGDKFDTSSVTTMSAMFDSFGSDNLINLDLGDKFDTSNVTTMEDMFGGLINEYFSARSLNLGDKFNTAKVTTTRAMFSNCKNLEVIYAGQDFDITSLTTSSGMFSSCYKLVGGNGTTFNNLYTNVSYAKIDREGTPGYLTKIDNTYKVKFEANDGTNRKLMQTIVYGETTPLIKYNFSRPGYAFIGWNTQPNGTGTSYSDEQSVLNLTASRSTITLYAQWIEAKEVTYEYGKVASLINSGVINNKMKMIAGDSATGTTSGDTNIKAFKKSWTPPAEGTVTSTISESTSPYEAVIWFDNGTIYYYTEADALLLNSSANSMFQHCRGIKQIDTFEFDTSNALDMSSMFDNCQALEYLDLRSFDTSKVRTMANMFVSCSVLKSVDLSSFDTSKVTNMSAMFRNDAYLTKLDVSSFNTSALLNSTFMFGNCTRLTTIYASTDFVTTGITNGGQTFVSSSNIIGGAGTRFNSSNITHEYAHIDAEGNPGYFTEKANQRITSTGYSIGESKVKYNNKIAREGTYVEPVRRGYTRTSWNTNPDGTGTALAVNQDGSLVNDLTQDITVYPQWTGNTYTVHFDANGESGSMNNQTFTTGVPQNLTSNGFTSDRLFVGWNTKADGTGIKYENNQSVANLMESGTITLYAQWQNATLLAGETFAKKISNRTALDNSQINTDIKSITFDYYTAANRAIIAGEINNAIKVDTRDEGLISVYKVLDTTDNLYDVYVLSDYRIYANANCSQMFKNFRGVASINFNNFDTSKTTNMNNMFSDFGHNELLSLDLSSFNTLNVTNMNSMFISCGYDKMTTLNLGDNFDTSKVTDMQNMFFSCGYKSLTSLDLKNKFNTGKVITMYQMFRSCGREKMSTIDLGNNFDTSSVTTMQYMFRDCGYKELLELDLKDKFDTSNVTITLDMFFYCGREKLARLDLGDKFDTSKVTDMSSMFAECGYKELTSIDLGDKFNTQSVRSMYQMFMNFGREKLVSLDLGSNFDTSSAVGMEKMFNGCGRTSMTSINLGNKFNTSNVRNMASMFRDCGYMELQTINLGNLFNTSSCTNMSFMFAGFGFTKLTTLDLGQNFDTSSVTNMANMFDDCGKMAMTSLNLRDKFDTSNVTTMSYMFDTCGLTLLESLDLGDKFDTSNVTNMERMFCDCGNKKLTTFRLGNKFNTQNVQNMAGMFWAFGKECMTSLDLGSQFDTSSATNMQNMFNTCGRNSMTSINLGNQFNPSHVTNMAAMFKDCGYVKLESFSLGNVFDTSSATTMSSMFAGFGYTKLTSLDLGPNFDTSNVTNMANMFDDCGRQCMTSLNLGDKFNTAKVTNMSYMFDTCGLTLLEALDLGDQFDTSNVQNMERMFCECGRMKMKTLDLGDKFNTAKVTKMSTMFQHHILLETIYADSDLDLTALTASTNMFDNCPRLVGANGTAYSTSHKDASYAKIDRTGTPGYFTQRVSTVGDAKARGIIFKGTENPLKDDYGNKVIVPEGFKIASDSADNVTGGIVIEDADSTKHPNTVGSQFVWIPVGKVYTDVAKTEENAKTITLGRYEFGWDGTPTAYSGDHTEDTASNHNQIYGNAIAKDIEDFIAKANSKKGYYIGRYEARVEDWTGEVLTTNTNSEISWTGYTNGKLVEKGSAHVFHYTTQNKASELSRGMYTSNDFESDLMNSYAWDTAALFLQEFDDRTGDVTTNSYYEEKYSLQTMLSYGLKYTGTNNIATASNIDKICNVYDMADNFFEWSTETHLSTDEPCTTRGGDSIYNASYVAGRIHGQIYTADENDSFRPILYLN